MKIYFILLVLVCSIIQNSFAQHDFHVSEQETTSLEISYQKTTSLIFPASIISVDRGSKDVLVQKAKGVENVLLVKAGSEQFPETNLIVITGDGKLHSFSVSYSFNPSSVTYKIKNGLPVIFNNDQFNELKIASAANFILKKIDSIDLLRRKKYKLSMAVKSIYVAENVMYFKISIKNYSNINYDINFLKFEIRDIQKVKRTASQEVELKPVYVLGDLDKAVSNTEDLELVFAFPKFTIPDNKVIKVNLQEKNGGRNITLFLKNKHLLKAQKI